MNSPRPYSTLPTFMGRDARCHRCGRRLISHESQIVGFCALCKKETRADAR